MRNDVRAGYIMGRIVSNDQWARAHAVQILQAAQAVSAGLGPMASAELLAGAIDGALEYLLGQIRRADPDPGETRGWHNPHAPGEPCPFHDGILDR